MKKVNFINTLDIVIFCQAPADIPYLLTLYEKNKGCKRIHIFVVNVENIFRFLKELNLDVVQLTFIPYSHYSLKNVLDLYKQKKRIKVLINDYFLGFSNAKVFFFSRFEDWLTAAFVTSMIKRNEVIYFDHYDFSGDVFERRKINFRTLILKGIYYYLTEVDFKVEILEKLPEFNYRKYGIQRIVAEINPIVYSSYACSLGIDTSDQKTALFFITPSSNDIFDQNYDEIQMCILKTLKDFGWKVVVKGHPRLGIPDHISGLVDLEIPSYLPAEFIDSSDVDICLGVITAAIVHFSKEKLVPTYSLLNLFKFNDLDALSRYKRYLLESSNGKILFVDGFEHFRQIINNNIKYFTE